MALKGCATLRRFLLKPRNQHSGYSTSQGSWTNHSRRSSAVGQHYAFADTTTTPTARTAHEDVASRLAWHGGARTSRFGPGGPPVPIALPVAAKRPFVRPKPKRRFLQGSRVKGGASLTSRYPTSGPRRGPTNNSGRQRAASPPSYRFPLSERQKEARQFVLRNRNPCSPLASRQTAHSAPDHPSTTPLPFPSRSQSPSLHPSHPHPQPRLAYASAHVTCPCHSMPARPDGMPPHLAHTSRPTGAAPTATPRTKPKKKKSKTTANASAPVQTPLHDPPRPRPLPVPPGARPARRARRPLPVQRARRAAQPARRH